MKTHFAEVERGNESNPHDDWNEPICGTYSEKVENDWVVVDCKRCLRLKDGYNKMIEYAMEHSCKEMGEFVELIKNNLEV